MTAKRAEQLETGLEEELIDEPSFSRWRNTQYTDFATELILRWAEQSEVKVTFNGAVFRPDRNFTPAEIIELARTQNQVDVHHVHDPLDLPLHRLGRNRILGAVAPNCQFGMDVNGFGSRFP